MPFSVQNFSSVPRGISKRVDEVIFEEFKGTGNSEIVLDRKVADKRRYGHPEIWHPERRAAGC